MQLLWASTGAVRGPCQGLSPQKAITGGTIYGRMADLSQGVQSQKMPMLHLKLSLPQREMFGDAAFCS
jgi:hypothetical protein